MNLKDDYEPRDERDFENDLRIKKKIKPPAGISVENEYFLTFEPATFACLVHFYEYQGNALPPKPRRQCFLGI